MISLDEQKAQERFARIKARILGAILSNADAAELWLEIWERVFTNEGHGTLHDAHIPGFSLLGAAYGRLPAGPAIHRNTREVMQMDAGMDTGAVIDRHPRLLLHASGEPEPDAGR